MEDYYFFNFSKYKEAVDFTITLICAVAPDLSGLPFTVEHVEDDEGLLPEDTFKVVFPEHPYPVPQILINHDGNNWVVEMER
jgi:hypothetical protein